MGKAVRVWTIGHSTRPGDQFVQLLVAHQLEAVADVRRYPGSRRGPQFTRDALTGTLGRHGIQYVGFPELGGGASRCPIPQTLRGAAPPFAATPIT
jgi:uncharacterized protein (DUF488 family)